MTPRVDPIVPNSAIQKMFEASQQKQGTQKKSYGHDVPC